MIRTTVSITGIILAGAIFFSYTQPAYDDSQTVRTTIAGYNRALQKAAELQSLKQQLLSRYNALNPNDIDRLQKLLPDHVDNIRLILDMDNMAATRHMALSNVDISGNDSSAGLKQPVIGALGASSRKYDSLTLGFTATGTYTDFKQFLQDLQISLRIVDFVSLTIAPSGGSSLSGLSSQYEPHYAFGVNLKTYWLK
ncbi:MAG: hypothetical protein Q8R25_05075 [bacterium]|nr:hypothetical protein [bacterium]